MGLKGVPNVRSGVCLRQWVRYTDPDGNPHLPPTDRPPRTAPHETHVLACGSDGLLPSRTPDPVGVGTTNRAGSLPYCRRSRCTRTPPATATSLSVSDSRRGVGTECTGAGCSGTERNTLDSGGWGGTNLIQPSVDPTRLPTKAVVFLDTLYDREPGHTSVGGRYFLPRRDGVGRVALGPVPDLCVAGGGLGDGPGRRGRLLGWSRVRRAARWRGRKTFRWNTFGLFHFRCILIFAQ